MSGKNIQLLATRYAQAYLNVFGKSIIHEQIIALENASISLERNKRLLFFWRLSAIDPLVKALSVERIDQKYHLGDSIKKLCYLLLEHNRLGLLPAVLEHIVRIYRKKEGVEYCSIITAQPILQDVVKQLARYVEKKVKKKIIPLQVVDPTLIAGIRLQGQEFLWEHSVRKSLRSLSLALVR